MTPTLMLLVWTVALTFVLVLVASMGANMQVGLTTLAGNRDSMPELSGWAGRATRAHRNMMENLPLFIALVLVAHIAVPGNAMVLLGAQLFFWMRLLHAIVYIAGIAWLRTLAWIASVVGLLLIFFQLV